jgi:transcriptional antiterminator RfaH
VSTQTAVRENENNQWFLVQTKIACEPAVNAHLQRQGYAAYFPRTARRARCRSDGRRVRRLLPLFPQYVFCGLVVGEQCLGPVKSTRGVLGIVKFGAEYAVVPPTVVEGLRLRADPVSGLHNWAEEKRLQPGDPVRIADHAGPFGSLEGIFKAECGLGRVLVLLHILGKETPVKISEALVEFVQHSRVRWSA